MEKENQIKQVRKYFKLTQAAFGARIGASRDAINNAENNRAPLTGIMIKAIVGEFNINEEWLRTGEGEMFSASSDDLLSQLAKQYNLSAVESAIMETYLHLPQQSRDIFQSFVASVSQTIANKRPQGLEKLPIDEDVIDIVYTDDPAFQALQQRLDSTAQEQPEETSQKRKAKS